MWKLNWSSIGGDEEESSEGFLEDESQAFCSLSPTQRIYAFAACLAAGLACMFLSLIVFVKPMKFAVLFTFGNFLAVGSTVFLIGTSQQVKMMFDRTRMYATLGYIGCVVIALLCALLIFWGIDVDGGDANTYFVGFMFSDSNLVILVLEVLISICLVFFSAIEIHNKILTIIAIMCEICALIWYSLSYIPFARRMVSELMVRFCDTEL